MRVMSKSVMSTVERPAVSSTRSTAFRGLRARRGTARQTGHQRAAQQAGPNGAIDHRTDVISPPRSSASPREWFRPVDRPAARLAAGGFGASTRADALHDTGDRRRVWRAHQRASRVPLVSVGVGVERVAERQHDGALRRRPGRCARRLRASPAASRPCSAPACRPSPDPGRTSCPRSAPARCSRPRATCCRRGSSSVTTRSTCVPGTTNPATPITSFTFTEMARMPAAIVGGRPAPASSTASFVDVSGSFSTTGAIRPRFTTSSTLL